MIFVKIVSWKSSPKNTIEEKENFTTATVFFLFLSKQVRIGIRLRVTPYVVILFV